MPFFAETDWTAAGVGALFATVITAIGILLWRVIPVRTQAQIDRKAADAKLEKDRAADKRKADKQALDEWRELAEANRQNWETAQQRLVDSNNAAQKIMIDLALCRREIDHLKEQIEECRQDRDELWATMEKAGIPIAHRPARRDVIVPHGPVAPDGDQ